MEIQMILLEAFPQRGKKNTAYGKGGFQARLICPEMPAGKTGELFI